jgi:cobaltochelatase CobN
MTRKRIIIIISILLIVIIAGIVAWNKLASKTKIALVNFQQFQTTSIIKSNNDNFIKYDIITIEELDKIKKYDFVIIFGMGFNVSEEQRNIIQKIAAKGTPILTYAATNPENNINNLDSLQNEEIMLYLQNGSRINYQNLARYVRKNIDKKTFFVETPEPFVESASDVLYHLDDNVSFTTVDEYDSYLKKNNFYKEGAPKVAILGGFNDPFGGNKDNLDSMISVFQNSGLNVYPISSIMKRLDFLKEIEPDAVVYFAHGRMVMGQPDAGVEWLKEKNIPIFSPLTMLKTCEEWENEQMGMFGGLMSQSIVVPELDGAIYPYVVNAQEVDGDGLYVFKALPDRLEKFTQIVNNFISLKHKKNSEKKIAIYYFKGVGQETLVAQGMETVPSLYNFLKRLKSEGYKVENLPATEKEFKNLLMAQGAIFSTYAEGAFDDYLKEGNPALVEKSKYKSWISRAMPESAYKDVVNIYGEAPGAYMSVKKDDNLYLAVARVEFGNIVLLPQPVAGLGDDDFAIVHGAKMAPPHTYIGAYLWSQYEFNADAILHFGTHGSLEFTPQKQVALSNNDWSDILIGTTPHFYYYTIGNIGESMMAKRRSYASIVSYLTPPFMESEMREHFKELQNKIRDYYNANETNQSQASIAVKKIAVEMGLHRELRLDSIISKAYTIEDIERIENFAEEISNEKMTGQLYITGVPYDDTKIRSSVMAMCADPIAYSLSALDIQSGKVISEQLKSKSLFTQQYIDPAKNLVSQVLDGKPVNDELICKLANISEKELNEAKEILVPPKRGMPAMMVENNSSSSKKEAENSGGHPAWIPKIGKRPTETIKDKNNKKDEQPKTDAHPAGITKMGEMPDTIKQALDNRNNTENKPEYTKEQKERARAIVEIERTIININNYKNALEQSPEFELKSLLNALSGGYISPSSGGDAIANPNAVPTGRNLYAINAEATPSEIAWEKGISLANATLEQYKKQHGEYPKKISYTFWSSEFIESEGATIAQVLYMLGVEPIRDAYGRVQDIRLIPSESLARPRIDVVIQTSGQFRDLAASRLNLISQAVEMAAYSTNDKFGNHVSESTVEIERQLVDNGVPPKDAREMSSQRIFGGINGMYGTGIQEMVKSGDKWEDEKEIAETYIKNMGAVYSNNENWGEYYSGLLHAVLHNTNVVVQPRQSNTWGALSLDHVFEFMGGINLAVRNVTGKDPDAYFADYRNRNNMKMQELKEAIGVEARTTVFNPAYIKEVMKGKASSASQITEIVTNTYAWNVMKPDVVDNEMWNQIYNIYIKDYYGLEIQNFFKTENPFALQEITAVMMETARKGMWTATEQQLVEVAQLHTNLVKEFGHSGSGFSGSNVKLQDFIAQNVSRQSANEYKAQINKMKTANPNSEINSDGMVLKKDSLNQYENGEKNSINSVLIVSGILVAFVLILLVLRKKRKNEKNN